LNESSITEKKTILVAEDDVETNRLITGILNLNNFHCQSCFNGNEVLSYARENGCDLILMDIMMPSLDGIETMKIIINDERLKTIPVILLTVKSDEETIKELFDLGIQDYIQKPFKTLELIARINSALKNKQEKENLFKKQETIIKKTNYLEKLTEDLKNLDDIKDNFIAYVAHDFKIPITSIRAFTELLLQENIIPPQKRKEYLATIIKQVDILNEMINDLLHSFKKIAGTLQLKISKVNVKNLCETVFSGFSGLAAKKNLAFEININSLIEEINCDNMKIKELLSNLLSNAFKYTEKGSVNFNVYENDNYLCFEISDTGIGITDNEKDKIFHKFYRIQGLNRKSEGYGLGLFIAKKIALAHNGDIYVESIPEKGTKFTFALPLEDYQEIKNI
jgi:two-component system, sensor histidine kinase and response regulator